MNKNSKRLLTALFLATYLVAVMKLFVFKFTIHLTSGVTLKLGGKGNYGYNLIPFKTIVEFVTKDAWGLITIGNILVNIVLFMPIGIMAPHVYPKIGWKGVFWGSLGFSLMIEVLQAVLRAGTSDVDDLILNTLGGLLGYFLFLALEKLRAEK